MNRITGYIVVVSLGILVLTLVARGESRGGLVGPGEMPWDQHFVHHRPDPVNVRSGNMILFFEDIRVPFMGISLDLARTYNSRSSSAGSFGYGWTANFDVRLQQVNDEIILVFEDDGSQTTYRLTDGSGQPSTYLSASGLSRIVRDPRRSTYTRYLSCSLRQVFDNTGRLIEYSDSSGNSVRFEYNNGRLARISDTQGRSIAFDHDSRGLVTSARSCQPGLSLRLRQREELGKNYRSGQCHSQILVR